MPGFEPRNQPGHEARSGRTSTGATLGTALLAIVVGSVPVWLVGGLAFQLTVDLDFDLDGLGLAVAVFFGAAALCSVAAGRLVQRRGSRFGMASTGVLSAASLAGLAFAQNLTWLLVCVAVAGVANSSCQPSTNMSLTSGLDVRRQGLAFGIKQSAIPMATLVAGLAVPLLALTVGWRWAFVAALAGPLGLLVITFRTETADQVEPTGTPRTAAVCTQAMIVLAAAGGFGSAAATSLGAFVVDSAISSGITAAAAGTALAAASLACITGRVYLGWAADRRTGGHLWRVALLMAIGAVLLLGVPLAADPVVLILLIVAIYCTGWGWPGLYSYAIVTRNPGAAGSASGILMTGIYSGGVVGPLAFGLIVHRAGYDAAWIGAACTLLAAAALVLLGRLLLRRDIAALPPSLAHT